MRKNETLVEMKKRLADLNRRMATASYDLGPADAAALELDRDDLDQEISELEARQTAAPLRAEQTMLEARRRAGDVFEGPVRMFYHTVLRGYTECVLESVSGDDATVLVEGRRVKVNGGGDNVLCLSVGDLNAMAAHLTCSATMAGLVAKGGYRPTLRGGFWYAVLANHYDLLQRNRGDGRRAYRGSDEAPEWVKEERMAEHMQNAAERHFEAAARMFGLRLA